MNGKIFIVGKTSVLCYKYCTYAKCSADYCLNLITLNPTKKSLTQTQISDELKEKIIDRLGGREMWSYGNQIIFNYSDVVIIQTKNADNNMQNDAVESYDNYFNRSGGRRSIETMSYLYRE